MKSTFLLAALFVCHLGVASATHLTGAIVFTADANGSYIPGGVYGSNAWSSRVGYNNGAVSLFLKSGPDFINADGSGNLFNVDLDLQPGDYTFDFFANGFEPFSKSNVALNLFFDGAIKYTGITALNRINTAGSSVGIGANPIDDTLTLDANGIAAAGGGTNAYSLVYADGSVVVTLTAFSFFTPDGVNLVADGVAVPDQIFDSTGSFTINVASTIPEPSTFLLLGSAVAGFGMLRWKRRK